MFLNFWIIYFEDFTIIIYFSMYNRQVQLSICARGVFQNMFKTTDFSDWCHNLWRLAEPH